MRANERWRNFEEQACDEIIDVAGREGLEPSTS
jgi:hypothetical protein